MLHVPVRDAPVESDRGRPRGSAVGRRGGRDGSARAQAALRGPPCSDASRRSRCRRRRRRGPRATRTGSAHAPRTPPTGEHRPVIVPGPPGQPGRSWQIWGRSTGWWPRQLPRHVRVAGRPDSGHHARQARQPRPLHGPAQLLQRAGWPRPAERRQPRPHALGDAARRPREPLRGPLDEEARAHRRDRRLLASHRDRGSHHGAPDHGEVRRREAAAGRIRGKVRSPGTEVTRRASVVAIGLLVAVAMAWPGAARAADVTRNGAMLTYAPRALVEANRLIVSRLGTDLVFTETGSVSITQACGGASTGPSASCPSDGVTSIAIGLASDDDTLTVDASVGPAPAVVASGAADGTSCAAARVRTSSAAAPTTTSCTAATAMISSTPGPRRPTEQRTRTPARPGPTVRRTSARAAARSRCRSTARRTTARRARTPTCRPDVEHIVGGPLADSLSGSDGPEVLEGRGVGAATGSTVAVATTGCRGPRAMTTSTAGTAPTSVQGDAGEQQPAGRRRRRLGARAPAEPTRFAAGPTATSWPVAPGPTRCTARTARTR